MRPLVLTGALALLLAFAPVARAQDEGMGGTDKPKDAPKTGEKGEKGDKGDKPDDDDPPVTGEKLPWNPFEKAKEGDWAAYTGALDVKGGPMGDMHQTMSMYWKITKIDGDSVTVKTGGSGMMGNKSEQTKTFSKKDTPTLQQLFEMKAGKVSDLKSEDAKETVEGKEFSGKRYSFKTTEMGPGKAKSELFLSQEAKGLGLVKMTVNARQPLPNSDQKAKITIEMHIGGYGNNDTVEWGKTYKDLAADVGGDDAPSDPKPSKKKPKPSDDGGDDSSKPKDGAKDDSKKGD